MKILFLDWPSAVINTNLKRKNSRLNQDSNPGIQLETRIRILIQERIFLIELSVYYSYIWLKQNFILR